MDLKINRLTGLLLLIQWIVLLLHSSVYSQTFDSTPEGVEFIEGQIIVRFNQELSKSELESVLSGTNFNVKKVLVRRLNIYLLSINADEITTPDALEEIRLFPEVKTAQLDHVVTMRQLFPDDEQFDNMWDMHNTGQLGGVEDADIDAPEAWEISTGGGTSIGDEIVVAVIDGGVDINHEDLIDNLWVNVNEIPNNGLDDDENGYIDDINGWNAYSSNGSIPSDAHGTHVAGTIGARGNNGTDVAGVSWDVKIMAVAGASSQTSTVLEAYGYVLDQKSLWIETGGLRGANVVATNSSFGIDFADCESGDYPLWNDMYDSLGAVGILSAAATINANQNVDNIGDVPTGCSSEYMIAVTNTTRFDDKYGSAGYGVTTIDLGAPGTDICSTVPGNGVNCSYTGTSMATPHVAGAVGLLHAAASQSLAEFYKENPDSGAVIIRDILFAGVDSLTSLNEITVTGGRLNIYNSCLIASTWNTTVEPLRGDVNGDGRLNVIDVIILGNFILGRKIPSEDEFIRADWNRDGYLDVFDIVSIILAIINTE